MRLEERIPDGGLRLGVIDAWLRAGALPDVNGCFDAAVTALRADDELHVTQGDARVLDLDTPPVVDAVLAYAVAALGGIEVTDEDLAKVEELHFDGGNDVYCDLILDGLASRLDCEFWQLDTGGETEEFTVRSLEGVSALPSLRSINLDAFGYCASGHDLRPLEAHPTLADLFLTGPTTHGEALLTLPSLSRVRLFDENALDAAVVDALRDRGVTIE